MSSYREGEVVSLDTVALMNTRPDAQPTQQYVKVRVLAASPEVYGMTWVVGVDGGPSSPLWVWKRYLRRDA